MSKKKDKVEEKLNFKDIQEEKISELNILKQSIDDKKKEADVLKDKYIRLVSEFENYKKRVDKEKAELLHYGTKNILTDILPVIDSFDKSFASVNDDKFIEGIKMIHTKLMDILEKNGLKKMKVENTKFDPHFHEAVDFKVENKVEENTVLEELYTGYMFHEKVLRPAMVKVSKKEEK